VNIGGERRSLEATSSTIMFLEEMDVADSTEDAEDTQVFLTMGVSGSLVAVQVFRQTIL
jgi:hypothetical protein